MHRNRGLAEFELCITSYESEMQDVIAFNDMTKVYLLLLFAILLVGCSHSTLTPGPIPEHDIFKSEFRLVGETRTIRVWTPPGYSESKT